MEPKVCCFTGHRSIPAKDQEKVINRLEETVISLILEGYSTFKAGGALGFDTVAAKTVLSLRTHYPHIRLVLVLPCVSQADRWPEADVTVYRDIMTKADEVQYTSQKYTRGCMFKRNRRLVDGSDVCVCYLTKESGGTAYTVRYAKKNNLRIINLGESDESQ